jgi:hypothetical protein
MGITLTVRDQSSTGKSTGTVELEDIPTTITLRHLIRTRVREEVARYNSAPKAVFAGLVMPEGAEPVRDGFAMRAPRRVDWEKQADRAVKAFGRNAFFLLIDDRQVTDLDEELELTVDSDIRFVRLVQLVGG